MTKQNLEEKVVALNAVNKDYEKLKKIVSQARSVELGIITIVFLFIYLIFICHLFNYLI
jgi:hypothetical protein